MTKENISLQDKFSINSSNTQSKYSDSFGIKGWVKIYKNAQIDSTGNRINNTGELILDDHNLVLAQGREICAYKLFGISDNTNNDKFTITHFGIGAGGATIDSNRILQLEGPFICDVGLNDPVKLGTVSQQSEYLNEPSFTSDASDPVYTSEGAVKPIGSTNIDISQEKFGGVNETTCDRSTRVKCTCHITDTEPVGLDANSYVPISEACLYASYVNSGETTLKAFSKICFAPKSIKKSDTLTIEWYILC